MRVRSPLLVLHRALVAALLTGLSFALAFAPSAASAQARGFELNRYEPTAAGEWSFFVAHPWYSRTRYLSVGLSMNYAHAPLSIAQTRPDGSIVSREAIIAHQLTGHLDIAGSALDRLLITASLPVALLERGQPSMSTGLAPADNPYVSDPRLGAMVRLFGQPYADPISMSLGGQIWIPLRAITDRFPEQASDQQVRGRIELALGGLARHFMWSFTVGTLIRPAAVLGAVSDPAGRTAGHELQLGVSLAYADTARRIAIGPEVMMATAMSSNIFQPYYTSLEALVGLHYNIARLFELGVAGGVGLLRQAGTPDGRALLRFAYAPMGAQKTARPVPQPVPQPPPQRFVDSDSDGIMDAKDQCPTEPRGQRPDPILLGCPLRDRDGDGLFDRDDQCPDQPLGDHPDPNKPGCPMGDRDGDGVLDGDDQCPDQSNKPTPDPRKSGCPAIDSDNDGVLDNVDICPNQAQGSRPDPNKPGCPETDRDGDGVYDSEDLCIDTPAGALPDSNRRGCPASDRDRDYVPDPVDACPDKPGVPDPDPAKNGCPTKLVEIRAGQVVIKQQIFFAFNKDVIMPASNPVLQAVALTLLNTPQIKKLRVEGHTDSSGNPAANQWLSARRAEAVMRWLSEHGVDAGRLEAQGFGDTRPIGDNATQAGRVKNRRVDFIIIE